MSEDCFVCTEKYNKSTRKRVTCPECEFSSCVKCYKKYLLDIKEDARCMGCRKIWDRMFLAENFPKSWLHRDYKNHRENLLLERHDASLQNYQPHVISIKRSKEYEKIIGDLYDKIRKINRDIDRYRNWAANERSFAYGRRNEQPDPRDILEKLHSQNLDEEERKRIEKEAKEKKEKMMIQRGPCPSKTCKGFIINDWKCGVCDSKICSKCMIEIKKRDPSDSEKDEEKEEEGDMYEEHVCTEEDIASAKRIRQDSKNCPKCRVRIYKIVGCNQMFCTQCHTFFDWRTLEIIRGGMVHNPHYIDYVNRHGAAQITQNICGQQNLNYEELSRKNDLPVSENNNRKKIQEQLRQVYETMESNRDGRRRSDMEQLERELGIMALQNEISIENRKIQLQKKKKEMDKLNDTLNVRELWCDQVYTYIYNYCRGIEGPDGKVVKEDSKTTLKNIEQITSYCQKCMDDIGSWYNSSSPRIVTHRYYYR